MFGPSLITLVSLSWTTMSILETSFSTIKISKKLIEYELILFLFEFT
jgi:hypothetical protein